MLLQRAFFQEDEAPSQFAHSGKPFSQKTFPEHWIGQGGYMN